MQNSGKIFTKCVVANLFGLFIFIFFFHNVYNVMTQLIGVILDLEQWYDVKLKKIIN